eukprot:6587145-Pyramimonas_sp.AAC.2
MDSGSLSSLGDPATWAPSPGSPGSWMVSPPPCALWRAAEGGGASGEVIGRSEYSSTWQGEITPGWEVNTW